MRTAVWWVLALAARRLHPSPRPPLTPSAYSNFLDPPLHPPKVSPTIQGPHVGLLAN